MKYITCFIRKLLTLFLSGNWSKVSEIFVNWYLWANIALKKSFCVRLVTFYQKVSCDFDADDAIFVAWNTPLNHSNYARQIIFWSSDDIHMWDLLQLHGVKCCCEALKSCENWKKLWAARTINLLLWQSVNNFYVEKHFPIQTYEHFCLWKDKKKLELIANIVS